MDKITKREVGASSQVLTKGGLVIYPTDTIYGIGCDATNEQSVVKLRKLKQREQKPFSIIAPSKRWIKENCELNKTAKKWLKKLPGPYTLLLPLKDKTILAASVARDMPLIGVRIPKHWFRKTIKKLGKPFVTTSVNIAGEPHITRVDQLPKSIEKGVDLIIDDGECDNPPSTIVNTVTGEVVER